MRSVGRILLSIAGLILLTLAAIAQGRSQAAGDAAASRARGEVAREKWLRVSEVFSLAGIAPGAKVADIGAGEGFLTVRLARAVGPSGRVYANDINPRELQALRERAREEGLDNVEVVEGAIDDPRLPRESLDAAIILNAYHEMSANDAMLRHILESLKPTGRLVLVEPALRLVAPDRKAQRKAEVLSAQLAEGDLRNAGFQIAELRDPFVTEISRNYFMWLIVAHRAPGILLAPVRAAGRGPLPADGRKVVTEPGKDDIMRADLRMSAEEVQKRISRGSATIVDLRSDAEYRSGHIRGAIYVMPYEIDAKLSEIASRKGPVFLYTSCD
jgi:predicted methyltransferase